MHRVRIAAVRRLARSRWRVLRAMLTALLASPPAVRVLVGAAVILVAWSAVNWVYQAINKPSEVFFPVSDALVKTPPETWQQYGPLFKKHSTAVITPALLAALAQVETEEGAVPLALEDRGLRLVADSVDVDDGPHGPDCSRRAAR